MVEGEEAEVVVVVGVAARHLRCAHVVALKAGGLEDVALRQADVRARRDAVRLAERDHLGRLVEDVLLEGVDDGAVARELEGRLDLVDRRAVGGREAAAVSDARRAARCAGACNRAAAAAHLLRPRERTRPSSTSFSASRQKSEKHPSTRWEGSKRHESRAGRGRAGVTHRGHGSRGTRRRRSGS